jgi:PH and SEC7 domain-containing protein
VDRQIPLTYYPRILQEIYSAIRMNQILQPTGGATLGRSNSRRGPKHMDMKRGSMRIASLIGSQQNLSGGSLDGRLSPSPSFATSINEATLASTLMAPAPGFATNLSHTIIKETQEDDAHSIKSDASDSTNVSISDEELALLGAPWAKEGMVSRKIYWESTGKRSKNKAWSNIFVVIQKGQLNMYIFGGNNMQNNRKAGVFGGGNWLSNATNVGEYMLAHSLAHVLPPPGLAGRPHCFVLTLASGMCFFFQAGTEDLCNEWVSTCNYWAARQSKEPLAGGVSNMEYGWSRVELEVGENSIDLDKPGSINSKEYNSETFSIRSGRSKIGRFDGFNTMRSSPLADRIYINDWRPPGHSMIASTHDEETQLDALVRQTTKLKSDLKTHNDLREPMIALVCDLRHRL